MYIYIPWIRDVETSESRIYGTRQNTCPYYDAGIVMFHLKGGLCMTVLLFRIRGVGDGV